MRSIAFLSRKNDGKRQHLRDTGQCSDRSLRKLRLRYKNTYNLATSCAANRSRARALVSRTQATGKPMPFERYHNGRILVTGGSA